MSIARQTPLPRGVLQWSDAPRTETLDAGDIHIIAVALDEPDAAARSLIDQAITAAERTRADRFHFAVDRDRFLVGRAVLRGLLAQHTGRAPDDIPIVEGARGKPLLAAGIDDTLQFNVSHSRGLALVALTRLGELGIDVEAIHDLSDLVSVAERYFAPDERAVIRELDGQARIEAFFTCWTRKEAYIKALGEGLAHPLDRFVVAMRAGEPARFLRIGDDTSAASAWTLADLRPAPGFVGALAIQTPNAHLRCWRW